MTSPEANWSQLNWSQINKTTDRGAGNGDPALKTLFGFTVQKKHALGLSEHFSGEH